MAAADDESGGRRESRSLWRALITGAFTIVLVAAEFGLLYGVYHRPDPVRHQIELAAGLEGRTHQALTDSAGQNSADQNNAGQNAVNQNAVNQNATGANNAARGRRTTAAARVALHGLERAGTPKNALAAVTAATNALAAAPGDLRRLDALDTAATGLTGRLEERRDDLDHQASAIYGTLLLVVSIGWFLWFRKLVQRHRALQQAVTEREALAASEQRLLTLVQNAADVVTVLDVDSTTSFVSPSSQNVLGTPADQLLRTKIIDHLHPDDANFLMHLMAGQRSGADDSVKLRARHADGRLLVLEGVLTNLLADPMVGGFVLTVRDVTERNALEERLRHQAFHDSLTGLANRQLFGDRLAHALARRAGVAQPLVVLFCDLDDFKNVNDSLGHNTGDLVLEEVGKRILAMTRPGDTAARLGGDEFAILMDATDLDDAEAMARRLADRIAEPLIIDGTTLPVTASIGLAQATPGAITTEEALRNADVAMYRAKDRGKSNVAVYDSELHAEALDRLELRADLQRALRHEELVLHYQPVVELETGRIAGFEALVRWQHPTRGLLSPAFFVPMAEETGLIVQLGTWVLFEACRTAALLQTEWHRPTMAVNVSAQQLMRPDFVSQVVKALADAGLPADRLTVEITESVVLHDLADVVPRLSELRTRGARVAIDDFGTGYSSLAYLTDLPVDVLKVDKSFIDRVSSDEQGASLTEAIISMSHTMNFSTVAEGVEVAEQAAWLKRVHCPLGQGYFWSRPVDLPSVLELLAKERQETLLTV